MQVRSEVADVWFWFLVFKWSVCCHSAFDRDSAVHPELGLHPEIDRRRTYHLQSLHLNSPFHLLPSQ